MHDISVSANYRYRETSDPESESTDKRQKLSNLNGKVVEHFRFERGQTTLTGNRATLALNQARSTQNGKQGTAKRIATRLSKGRSRAVGAVSEAGVARLQGAESIVECRVQLAVLHRVTLRQRNRILNSRNSVVKLGERMLLTSAQQTKSVATALSITTSTHDMITNPI